MKFLASLTLCLVIALNVQAQVDNQRSIWVKAESSLITGNIAPGSIHLSDSTIYFEFDQGANTLHIPGLSDSVQVFYRVLAVTDSIYANKDLSMYDSTARFKDYVLDQSFTRESLFETGNVHTSGRLSRGFTMGTNQDVFVNSALNLTMDGQLSDDLNIQATITDQQIPFQPEGNTAQLQDLDRVYMRIYNDKVSVTAGDIALRNQTSHFLKYYKNVKGAAMQLSGANSQSQLGASVAKGKFATIAIAPQEGIQGPYRIPGPEGQDFVVVLANSERVFIDGVQLQRGFDMDYTIDYNMGEITFTPKVIITQFSRIRVDYEYADNRYSRFILAAGHQQTLGKFSFGVNAYSEKDNKNSPNFDLTNEDKKILYEAGDDLLEAVVTTADSVEYDQNRVLYKKIVVGSSEIFVYSTDPDSAIWEVTFNRLGPNSGNYRQKITSINGRVYEYVPPVNGIMQGEYEPYTVLPAPTKKQMVELNGTLQVTEYESVSADVAISDHDLNLFSNQDNGNNIGQALRVNAASTGRPVGEKGWQIETAGGMEYLAPHFRAVDRFRDVEFDRDWSYFYSSADSSSSDLILRASAGLKKDGTNQVTYDIAHRSKEHAVEGYQHNIIVNKDIGKFRLLSNLFTSTNDVDLQSAYWKRLRTDLSYLAGLFRVGYQYQDVAQEYMADDSVTYSANFYNQHMAYVRSESNEKESMDASFRYRETFQPYEGRMIKSNTSKTLNLNYRRKFSSTQDLGLMFNYRELQNESDEVDFGSGTSVTSQLNWLGSFFKRSVRNDLTWSVSSGRDLKKEYVFIEVPTGQGNYTWIDYNGDGIMDLNEFNLTNNIDERNYAKIFVPTSEYVDAYENTLNYKFYLQFPREWRKLSGLRNLLSKVSNNTTWTSLARTTDPSISSRLFAFVQPMDQSDVLSARENFRTTWFFNRTNPKYGFNAGYYETRFRSLLTGGFEDKGLQESNLTGRVNLGRFYSLQLVSKIGKENAASDFLLDRNFSVTSNSVKPIFTWQPKPTFRVNVGYGNTTRSNNEPAEDLDRSQTHEVFADLKISRINKLSLQTNLVLSKVGFVGNQQSPVGYVVLNGLQPGMNVNWSVVWQQTLINGLQLAVFYNGRKGEEIRTIHSGSVSISALF